MTIRLAAIGFQHQHVFALIGALLAEPGVALVGLTEHDPELRDRAAQRYGVPAYADYRELLERVRPDAAVLAPINRDKPTVIADCAAAGVHVYVDKPMATTLDGVESISRALREHGTHLYLAVSGGYGASAAWKRLIDSGALGRLVQFVHLSPHRLRLRPDAGWTRPAWSYERVGNGGLIADVGVHAINEWRYLTGQEVARVTAVHGNVRFPEYPTFEDYASVLLEMTDGSTAFIGPTWLTPDAEPSHGRTTMVIVGSRGQLEIVSPGLAHGLEDRGEQHRTILSTDTLAPHEHHFSEAGLPTPAADFLAAIAGQRQPTLSPEFLIESQRIALLAREAADRRQTIEVR